MKSTKIALISLACGSVLHGGALAQTNVTIYGLLDSAVEYSSQGNGTLTRVQAGSNQGNRLGFKGVEQLGNGLEAIFVLENGFTIDNGQAAQSGRLFGRQAYVGFRGGAGTLTVGRQYSPYYVSMVQQDAFQWAMVGGLPAISKTSASGAVGVLLNGWATIGRVDNAVVYTSPNVNGLSTVLMVGLGEVAGNANASRVTGANLRYAQPAFDLDAGYTAARDPFDRGVLKAVNVGGNVTLGAVRVFAGYIRETNNSSSSATAAVAPTARIEIGNLGARYRFAPQWTLVGQVAQVRDRSEGLQLDRDATVYAAGVEDELSKRTMLYASVGTIGNRNGSNYSLGSGTSLGGPAAGNARARTANLGVKHVF